MSSQNLWFWPLPSLLVYIIIWGLVFTFIIFLGIHLPPYPEKTSFMDGPYVVVACQRQSAKIVCKHRIAWPWSLENSVTSWSVNIVSNVVICLIHLVEILSYGKFLILMGLHFQEKFLMLSRNSFLCAVIGWKCEIFGVMHFTFAFIKSFSLILNNIG